MNTQHKNKFSAKTIGYALAISVVLCLIALPYIAVMAYDLLMLLSLAVNYIGAIVYNNVYERFTIFSNPICATGNYGDYQLGCFEVILSILGIYILLGLFAQVVGLIIGFILLLIRLIIEGICRLFILLLQGAIYLLAIALSAVMTAISFIVVRGAILVGRLFDSFISGCQTLIPVIIHGLGVLFKLLLSGLYIVLRALLVGGWALLKLIGSGAYIALMFILSSSYVILRAILYGSVTGTYTALRGTLLGITIVIDWLFSKRRSRHICPNKDCGYIGTSSVYHCPHCGELLLDMKPSYGGIFYKECPNCHKSVGVSSLTGRNNYSIACPKCNNTWDYFDVGNVPSSVFIVDGAAQSGKTSFMAQMLLQWRSQFSENVHFLIDNQKNAVEQLGISIHKQQFCPSTPRLSHPEAYVMRHKKFLHSFLAYFYDTGGEDASSSLPAGIAEPYFNLANGIFWVIDPWAERCVLDAFRAKNYTRPQTYQYSKMDSSNVIGRLCTKLDHIYTVSRFDIPICVVVTKCDINRLDNIIGTDANYSQSPNEWAEQSQKVEEFLLNAGMHNFVNVIKTRFKKYAFFAVSVLDDSTHSPETVLNPLLWMIKNA